MSEKFILGLDIGYSNLKIVCGTESKRERHILPVGAAPSRLMPKDLRGGAADAIYVSIEDETYVAGVEPSRLQSWERELHETYTETKSYKALFYAALLMSGSPKIDILVTGLPVDQFKDESFRKRLEGLMKGVHQVSPKVSVEVAEVIVVPQPAGAYLHAVSSVDKSEIIEMFDDGRTLIIDPGFYSVDWVSFAGGEIQYDYSGTSQEAMSSLIEYASALIQNDYGFKPTTETIEKAIRNRKDYIFLSSQKVTLEPYLSRASADVAEVALTAMKRTLRKDDMNPDVVVIAGGGSHFYEQAARSVYPKAQVVVPNNPVMAIAEGYWDLGS